MIITFVSCFLNHHQLPLCEELKKNSDEFYFVATSPIPKSRLQMGYEDLNTAYDFVVRTYDGTSDKGRVAQLLKESDIVIFGTSPVENVEYRMKFDKPTFLYMERYFKKGTWRRFIPEIRNRIARRVLNHKDKKLFVLCASGFMASDLKLMGFDENKCFRWGYFPAVSLTEFCPERNNSPIKVLWTGRMLPLKHGELAVNTAAKLKDKCGDFTLDFIGSGECEAALKKQVSRLRLEDRVNFLGSMSPAEVLDEMHKADIFLMTSDFHEGWGAVVNESMGAGCAVLASSAVGSVPFLIKDKENGLVYQYGNNKDFERKLRILIEDAALRKRLGENAHSTMKNEYNAGVAASRLVEFVKNDCKPNENYDSGPMTKAPVLKNGWYKG